MILEGEWKHVRKSLWWENNNENYAKGKTGTFSTTGDYLRWHSVDGTATLFIEVSDHREVGEILWIKHRSGLEYWFKRIKHEKEKTKGRHIKIGGSK